MNEIKLLYKQFGFYYIVQTVLKRIVSPIIKRSSFYIVAIENHKSSALPDSVITISKETKDEFLKQNYICSSDFERQLNSFLGNGTIALAVIRNKEVAGWGFVQNKGDYKFANYYYKIPTKVWILKNLFILPKFRGQSIGKIINQARISIIDDDNIPLGFVIPFNKYAIRNLEMFGFTKHVFVKDSLWFKKNHKRKIQLLKDNNIALTIKQGLENEN